MRLKFNILCFEDNEDFLKPIFKQIGIHLDKTGYELKVVGIYRDSGELDKIVDKINSKKLDVDIIMMDYYLADNKNGDYLIKKIRDHNLYTDIIFYSQKANLEEVDSFDGIYYAARDTLLEKSIMVIDNLLKKALDLSNFRGLIMAETSELDDIMHHIILTFLDNKFFTSPEEERKIIKDKAIESLKKNLEKFENIDMNGPGGKLQLVEELDSFHKARTVTRLTKKFIKDSGSKKTIDEGHGKIILELKSNEFDAKEYKKEILYLRNILAHVKESKNDKGEKILRSTRPKSDDFVFDENVALKARKDLKKFYKILTGLFESLSGRSWE